MDKTFISIKGVAEKLGVSEKTIYRMVGDNQIPFAVKIGGQWRFKADEVVDWIDSQRPGVAAPRKKTDYRLSLVDALENGAVLYRIHGSNRDEIIDELLAAQPYSANFDAKAIKISLLSRESVASSSMDGIAWMWPDPALPVYLEKSMVILAFLEHPVDFKALDSRKTELLFLVLPANNTEMAILERKLWRLAMSASFLSGIREQLTRKKLLEFIGAQEAMIFHQGPAT
ncbi:MAG: helix-turn-helix domain-containing protein [Desulfurivibrionaceae bacterium]